MATNPINLYGLVACMAPNPMNLWGLVASMARSTAQELSASLRAAFPELPSTVRESPVSAPHAPLGGPLSAYLRLK